jgi:hypothetical protein
MDAHPATTLACRFALGVAGLRDMLIAHLIRTDYALPVLVFLSMRLHRLHRRIAALAERLAEGLPECLPGDHLPSPPATRPAAPSSSPSIARSRPLLPTAPGWLFDLDIRFATYAEYFRDLLDQPEISALLAAAPHLRRQLRSVLRPLMAELPAVLALPPGPPRPKPRPRPSHPKRAPRLERQNPCHGADRPKEFWRPGPIRPHWSA